MIPFRSILLGGLFGLALAGCGGDDDPPPATTAAITIPGATTFPEGVASDPVTRGYYVGSTRDGTIFRGAWNETTASVFSPGGTNGRTDVRGLKVDAAGSRLYAAGGSTGTVHVLDARTGAPIAALSTNTPAGATSFVNDIAVAPNGTVYATDSRDPVIHRVTNDGSGTPRLERWLPLAGTPIVYGAGFNLNGIVATPDGLYLLTVQSNTGRLYRVTVATGAVAEVAVTGGPLNNGDGLLLVGPRTLYVVRNANALIVKVEMSADYGSGAVSQTLTDPSFLFPTTVAQAEGRLLVVNSQLNVGNAGGTPTLPFTLANLPLF